MCNLIDKSFAIVLFTCILTPKSPCSSLSKMKVYELWTCFKVEILDILVAQESCSFVCFAFSFLLCHFCFSVLFFQYVDCRLEVTSYIVLCILVFSVEFL